jgi:hypothetical protein
VSDAARDAAIAYIGERLPAVVTVHVEKARLATVSLTGTVHVDAALEAAAKDEAAALLTDLAATVPIGGGAPADATAGGTPTGELYRAELIERLMSPAGVRNVVLAAPAADVPLDLDEIPEFDTTGLAWNAV